MEVQPRLSGWDSWIILHLESGVCLHARGIQNLLYLEKSTCMSFLSVLEVIRNDVDMTLACVLCQGTRQH
jgi:hypothetical protein